MNTLQNIAKTIPESYQLRNDQEVCAPHGIRKCRKGQLLLSNNLQEMKNQRIKELGGIRMENILSYFRPNMNVKELSQVLILPKIFKPNMSHMD